MSDNDSRVQVYVGAIIVPKNEDDPREMRCIWHPPLEDGELHNCGHSGGWAHPLMIDKSTGMSFEPGDDFEFPDDVLMELDAALLDVHAGIERQMFKIEDRG